MEPTVDDRESGTAGPGRFDARTLIFPAVVLLLAATGLAKALGPLLLRDAPLLLLVLAPDPPELLLVGAKIGLVPFLLVATLARGGADVVYYLLGRWYGPRALRRLAGWLGRGGGLVAWLERSPAWARDVAVLIFAGPPILAAVGVAGMPVWRYLALRFPGALALAGGMRLLGAAGAAPLNVVVAFIERHAIPLTVACAALTAVSLLAAWHRRRAAPSEAA